MLNDDDSGAAMPAVPKSEVMPAVVSVKSARLPIDLESYVVKLRVTRAEVESFSRWMDSKWLWGYVGVDPLLSLVPYVGDVASSALTGWVWLKGRQVHLSGGNQAVIVAIAVADAAIGFVPGFGDFLDFFFRSNKWAGELVVRHINMQLAQIEFACDRLAVENLPEDHPSFVQLRDVLFHSGRSQTDRLVRFGIIGAICVGLLGYCSFQGALRNNRVIACQQSGGWFCDWRN